MSTEEVPCSDEERYYKLDNMLLGSCEYVRNIFARRWKRETGENWVDEGDNIQRFLSGPGKKTLRKLQVYQKRDLKGSKSVGEWDLSLLRAVLGNFGEEKTYKEENAAVKGLKTIRNFLAHHCNKKVAQEEYLEKVSLFQTNLRSLGMEEKDIVTLIERVGVRSSEKARELLKDLFRQAEAFRKEGRADQAEECYSEGLVVPSLLPVHRGEAYEKRAAFFLGQIKDVVADANKCSNALLDAAKALELNGSSWVAHYLLAQCYRHQNKLSQAISHYQQALAISPAQKPVKADLDGCKVLAAMQQRKDHENPNLMPINLSERVDLFEKQAGIRLTKEEFLEYKLVVEGSLFPGQYDVFRGYQYLNGWDAPINFAKAVAHFKEAAKVKNAEGLYHLGLCFQDGRGVKQDVEEALRIYREVAEMDPKMVTSKAAVTAAQHCIGLSYENGIGVEQDLSEAVMWYTRAMGNGGSANNLGNLYYLGRGVAQDKKMAELCWKQGVALKDPLAPAALMGHYIKEAEPDRAKALFEMGREMGNPALLNITESEFTARLTAVAQERAAVEPKLVELERIHHLSPKGFTFRERMHRVGYLLSETPSCVKLDRFFDMVVLPPAEFREACEWGGKVRLDRLRARGDMERVFARAAEGSVTARNALKTLELSAALNSRLEAVGGEVPKAEETAAIVDLHYNCVQLETHLVRMSEESNQKLRRLLSREFKAKSGGKGEEDMKIRLCYVKLNLDRSLFSSDMYAVELLKEGLQRYPDNGEYYRHIVCLFGCKRLPEMGRLWAEKGLALLPEDVDLLYCLAKFLPGGPEKKATFKNFLAKAPYDHPKVPEVFYEIAKCYCDRAHESKEDLRIMETYYKRGLEAEGHQLPYYLPYGGSDTKTLVETTIWVLTEKRGSPVTKNPDQVGVSGADILERKPHLRSPTREGVFLQYRQSLQKMVEDSDHRRNLGLPPPPFPPQIPSLHQTRIKRVSALRPITLLEMSPTDDRIYENRCLDLTIMDDATPQWGAIHLLAEDENGDVVRVRLYNVEETEESLQNFQPGCRLAIMSPYMQVGAEDTTPGIRNDEPSNLVYLEKVEGMCRFCGEENASRKCGKCKRPYCSRQCQKLDWKMLNHKIICGMKLSRES